MTDTAIDRNLLRSQMVLRGVTCKDLADAQGWSMTTVYRKINGSVAFTVPEIQTCVKRLALDTETANAIFFNSDVS